MTTPGRDTADTPDAAEPSRWRLSVDWIAVLIAAVLVFLVGFGLLPVIPW